MNEPRHRLDETAVFMLYSSFYSSGVFSVEGDGVVSTGVDGASVVGCSEDGCVCSEEGCVAGVELGSGLCCEEGCVGCVLVGTTASFVTVTVQVAKMLES